MLIYEYSKRAGALMNRSFIKVVLRVMSLWDVAQYAKCEYGGCSECSTRCGHLDCNDIRICEMWTSPECTGTMLTNATTYWKVCGKALLL
jgi:hypothetical protein